MTNLPDYVDRPGVQTFAPPILAKDTRMQSFALRADAAALDALCDRYLNGPARGQTDLEFRPLGDIVLLANAPMAHISVTDPIDSNKGWMRETDVAFWMPVVGGRQHGGQWRAEMVAWFLPYVWVDVSTAVATGREVYGFPKELAWLDPPAGAEDSLVVQLSTMVLPTYTPQTELVKKALFRIQRTGGLEAEVKQEFSDFEHAVRELVGRLYGQDGGIEIPSWQLIVNLIENLLTGEMPMVFLKEFRDITQPHKACYQRIVQAPAKLEKFTIGYPYLSSYEVAISGYASHPVARDFGFAADADGNATVPALLGFFMQYDFKMELGEVLT